MTEAWKAHLVLHIEALAIEDKIDVICTCLDDLIEEARAGKVSKVAAEQVSRRADQIYASVVLPRIRGAA